MVKFNQTFDIYNKIVIMNINLPEPNEITSILPDEWDDFGDVTNF